MLQPTPQPIHVTRPARLAPYEYHLRPRTEFRNARFRANHRRPQLI